MKTIDEKLAVYKAYLEGKEIECIELNNPRDEWEYNRDPMWCWQNTDYRIKEIPKPKIKFYQWVLMELSDRRLLIPDTLYKDEESIRDDYDALYYAVVKKLDYEEIEIDGE